MKERNTLFAALLVLTLLRFALTVYAPPTPGEALHLLCAEQLDWAYYDGPPGTALLARVLTDVGNILAARASAPFFALLASLMAFALVRRMYDSPTAVWTVAALNALPLFNNSASRLSPLIPSLCFVLAGMLFAWIAWHSEQRRFLAWLAAGASFAIAALFRYDTILIPAFLALATLSSPRHRTREDIGGLLVCLLLIAAALAGPLAWNARLEWLPIAGGTLRTAWHFDAPGFFKMLERFFSSYSPLAGAALLTGLVLAGGNSLSHFRARFVFFCAIGPCLWWLYLTFRGLPGADLPLYAVTPIAAFLLSERKKLAWGAHAASATLLVAALCSVLVLFTECQGGRVWLEASDQLDAARGIANSSEHAEPFIIAEDDAAAAILGFHLRDKIRMAGGYPPVFVRESQDISSQFSLWPGYDQFLDGPGSQDEFFTEQKGTNPFIGRSALYISREAKPPQAIRSAFENTALLESVEIQSWPARSVRFYIFLCRNYQTMPL